MEAAVVGPGKENVTVTPAKVQLVEGQLPTFQVQSTGSGGSVAVVRVLATVYFCQDNDVCLYQQVCFDVPVGQGGKGSAGAAPVQLSYALSPKAVTVAL